MSLLAGLNRFVHGKDAVLLSDGSVARVGLRVVVVAPLHPEALYASDLAVHEITSIGRPPGVMLGVGPQQFHPSQLAKAPRSRRNEPVYYRRRGSDGAPAAWLGGRCPTHLDNDCDECAALAVANVQDVEGTKYGLGVTACAVHADGRTRLLEPRSGSARLLWRRCWFCHRDGRANTP